MYPELSTVLEISVYRIGSLYDHKSLFFLQKKEALFFVNGDGDIWSLKDYFADAW